MGVNTRVWIKGDITPQAGAYPEFGTKKDLRK